MTVVIDQDADERTKLLQNGQERRNGQASYDATANREQVEERDVENVGDDQKELSTSQMLGIIAPLAIGIFLSAMDATIVASSYASIGSEMQQLQSTSWIATGYLLTLTSFQPLYGKLSDIFGRKSCLLFAYSMFALGNLFSGLARNMTELIASRALAGLGGGGMQTVVSILVSDLVPLRTRGIWQGVLNIIFASGSASGGPLGGILTDKLSWRWAFLLQVPLTVLSITIVTLTLDLPTKETSDFKSKFARIDFVGALLLVLATFALLFGFDRGGNVSWSSTYTIVSLVASIILFAIFIYVETHPNLAKEPLAPKRIIAHQSLFAAYVCNFFCTAGLMCAVFNLALYFQAVGKMSASAAGTMLLPGILGGVSGSMGGGILMQRTGKFYWLTVGAFGMQTAGSIAIYVLTGSTMKSLAAILIFACFQNIGSGTAITSTLVALIANAAPEDQAIATAVSYLFRSLGSVVGLSIGSTVIQDSLRGLLRERLTGKVDDIDKLTRAVRESLDYIESLPPSVGAIVRGAYGSAIRAAFAAAVFFAGAAFVSSCFVEEKPLPSRVRRD